jgi:two-component system NarL family sensor kinase
LYSLLPRLDPHLELSLYRMIQELIQNIIKHAQATEAIVQMGCHQNLLSITVEDNGAGIKETIQEGTGLNHIRTRINALNGHFDIQGTKTGTTAYIEISIEKEGKYSPTFV